MIEAEGDVLAFEREHEGERIVVALNLGGAGQTLPFAEAPVLGALLSTISRDDGRGVEGGIIHLAPDEGLILLARAG